jgi:hypothetical protein
MRPALFLLLALASPAIADEPAYLDDRSTPEAVVASYYNAIERQEFARAYSYFGSGSGPEYEGWKAGYAETRSVSVSFGRLATEGAAGSTYYSLPVRLDATNSDGSTAAFAGCYVLRLAQPTIQEPPFEGIHIESATLHAAKAGEEPPESCD